MKKKKLEMMLQKVPKYKKPDPQLEQYITPAGIAADIIFKAYQFNNIQSKKIIDLACGTGIFSVGAAILGAKEVIGIDIDQKSIEIAEEYAKKTNLDIEFINQDIKNVNINCDTVIMNPPFGAQKKNYNADRKFIQKAFEISSVTYSLHLTKTIPFIKKMTKSLGGKIDYSKRYNFPIKRTYKFHTKETLNHQVTLLRINTQK